VIVWPFTTRGAGMVVVMALVGDGSGAGAGGGFELAKGLLTGGGIFDRLGPGFGFELAGGGGTMVAPSGVVAGGIGVVGVGRVSAAGVVGVVMGGGGGGGFPPPPTDVVCAGVLLGVVRPSWRVKARGGSQTPNVLKPQVDQSGSILLIPDGNDNCGVQILVRIEC
jgi:hypothetical protein